MSLGVAGVALAVATAAAWSLLPRPPALHAERWFKLTIATLLRGRVDAAKGDVETWERDVLRFVPFHPGGRDPERKVADPEHYVVDGLSEPGELALLAALRGIDGVPERWARMYDADEVAVRERLVDPDELGEAYDPKTWLGPDASWDLVADWGAGEAKLADLLRARHPARWVLVRGADEGRPDVLAALADALGDRAVVADDVVAALQSAAPDPADRMVVVVSGDACRAVLQALIDGPQLRDRMAALLAVGGRLAGTPELEDWLSHWFAHESLDTEVNRKTPYLSVAWFDRTVLPPGVPGLPIGWQRFPTPRASRMPDAVERVDLGLLPSDPELPVDVVARALWITVTLVVLARS